MPEFITRTCSADFITPVRAYSVLYKQLGHRSSFLFESVVPGERWGRYSILGFLPEQEGIYPGKDPLATLGAECAALAPPESLIEGFSRALVGYVTYDAVHKLHKIDPWDDAQPFARTMSDMSVVVFDNLEQTMTIGSRHPNVVTRCEREFAKAPELRPMGVPDRHAEPHDLSVSMADDVYAERVKRAKEYIAAGDVFQVVLARRFEAPMREADPFDVYRALRVLSPSPYLYFLHFARSDMAPALDIAGASPETMVRHSGRSMTLRPIAGTRPRGKTPEHDRELAEELASDPKERSEHVMLVDLARNDVGRVCETGSVQVSENMRLERYSHVMHLVSEVTGTRRADVGPGDVLKASFPAGTLTGAPKVRATQIIRELETGPRDHYGGAVGYFMPGGDFDLAIAIRTVVAQFGTFEVGAGAGIVEGSDPSKEAAETRNKAAASLAAIRAAQDAAEAKRAEEEAKKAAAGPG